MYRTIWQKSSDIGTTTENSVASSAVLLILPSFYHSRQSILQKLVKWRYSVIEKISYESTSQQVISWNTWNVVDNGSYLPIKICPSGDVLAILVQKEGVYEDLIMFTEQFFSLPCNSPGIYFSPNSVMAFRDISHFFPQYNSGEEFLQNTKDYLDAQVFPQLNRALTELAISRPEEPIKWLAEHLKEM